MPQESPAPLHVAVYGGGLGEAPPSMTSMLPRPQPQMMPYVTLASGNFLSQTSHTSMPF